MFSSRGSKHAPTDVMYSYDMQEIWQISKKDRIHQDFHMSFQVSQVKNLCYAIFLAYKPNVSVAVGRSYSYFTQKKHSVLVSQFIQFFNMFHY